MTDNAHEFLRQHGWPVEQDWTQVMNPVLTDERFQELLRFVATERAEHTIFPPVESVFRAFQTTPYAETKVVILGQDPYHGPGQAHGLSFSVQPGVRNPPSLRNVFKELVADLSCSMPTDGDLTPWARQGVLLLNTVLTVRQGEANSHRKRGWEWFTDQVILKLNQHQETIVFLLWGKSAEKKAAMIENQHRTIVSPHPSPLSARRGFFGSRPFSQINQLLQLAGREVISWEL